MINFNRRIVATLAVGLFMLASQAVQAGGRSIRVDAGDFNFDNSGEAWSTRTEIDFVTQPLESGTLPFALNFSGVAGAGQIYDFSFYADGTLPAGLDIGFGSFAGGNFGTIRPYFLGVGNLNTVSFSSGEWSIGEIDTDLPYLRSETIDAVRFTWRNGTISDGRSVAAQLVFLNRGAGDFDIEFNYGFLSYDFPVGGSQSLMLGPVSQHFESLDKVGYFGACYRDGVGSICSPAVVVPEPATVSLLALGLAVVAVPALRRRQQRIAERTVAAS